MMLKTPHPKFGRSKGVKARRSIASKVLRVAPAWNYVGVIDETHSRQFGIVTVWIMRKKRTEFPNTGRHLQPAADSRLVARVLIAEVLLKKPFFSWDNSRCY